MDKEYWNGRTFVLVGEAPLKLLVHDLFFRHSITPLTGIWYQDDDGLHPVTAFIWIGNPFRNSGWWEFTTITTDGFPRHHALDEYTQLML